MSLLSSCGALKLGSEMVGSFGFLAGTSSSLIVRNCCCSFSFLLSGETSFELEAGAGISRLLLSSVARAHDCPDTGSDVTSLLLPFSAKYINQNLELD